MKSELADLIAFEIGNTPSGGLVRPSADGATPVFESDDRLAGKILDAGYRKQRTVNTAEELDGLPFETVIRDAEGHVLERWGAPDEGLWTTVMVNAYIPRDDIALPVTVLYEPSVAA
ncbi:hypothetical protein SEA_ZUCKER_52 [Arthrobacter phage Zucker]|nr:hypothetical protein SEA_ZUCKER_52 [Arthrobacter phage Zucker]